MGERPRLTATELQGVINSLAISARGNARGEKRFHFRGKIECPFMLGVKKRLNAEAVAGGKKGLIGPGPTGQWQIRPAAAANRQPRTLHIDVRQFRCPSTCEANGPAARVLSGWPRNRRTHH